MSERDVSYLRAEPKHLFFGILASCSPSECKPERARNILFTPLIYAHEFAVTDPPPPSPILLTAPHPRDSNTECEPT